jgi:hypothetical protein
VETRVETSSSAGPTPRGSSAGNADQRIAPPPADRGARSRDTTEAPRPDPLGAASLISAERPEASHQVKEQALSSPVVAGAARRVAVPEVGVDDRPRDERRTAPSPIRRLQEAPSEDSATIRSPIPVLLPARAPAPRPEPPPRLVQPDRARSARSPVPAPSPSHAGAGGPGAPPIESTQPLEHLAVRRALEAPPSALVAQPPPSDPRDRSLSQVASSPDALPASVPAAPRGSPRFSRPTSEEKGRLADAARAPVAGQVPVIRVHVGRIDVRAVVPPSSSPVPASTPPRLTLSEYLEKQGQS